MQKRSVLIIALAMLALVLVLAACAETVPAGPEAPPQTAEPLPAPADETPPAESEVPAAPEETGADPAQESGAEEETGICHGHITDNVYINPFLGMQFPLPEGWLFFQDPALMRENSMKDPITTETLLQALKDHGVFLDMFASPPGGLSPLGIYAEVQYEKISPWAAGSGDETAYFTTARLRSKGIFAMYGVTDQKVSFSEGEIAGEHCSYADIRTYAGDACFVQRTFAVPRGDYIVLVTAIALDERSAVNLLNSFSPIEGTGK